MGAKTTEADAAEVERAVGDILDNIILLLDNPVEWTFCGACGCLLSSADEGGCPSCRYWLTAALEEETWD